MSDADTTTVTCSAFMHACKKKKKKVPLVGDVTGVDAVEGAAEADNGTAGG